MVSRLDRPNPPCVKKERNFKDVLIHNHSQQIFSADFFSRSSQQIFSADLLSRSSQQIFSQQIFSADLLSRFFQQIFSADLLSRFSSADLLSRSSQQIFSADLLSADFLSRSSQQIFSADLLSRSSQQIFSLSYHLLWSGVGGQLLSYHLLWSGVGGQLLSYHVGGLYCMSSLEGPFRGAFGKMSVQYFATDSAAGWDIFLQERLPENTWIRSNRRRAIAKNLFDKKSHSSLLSAQCSPVGQSA